MVINSDKDIKNFKIVFLSHHSLLCNISNRIVKDRSVAKDIVQKVFLKLLNRKEEIQINSRLKDYLVREVEAVSSEFIIISRKNSSDEETI